MEEVRPEQRPATKWNVVLDAEQEESVSKSCHRAETKDRGGTTFVHVEVVFTGVTACVALFDISLQEIHRFGLGARYLLSKLTV